jgi:hypothetical protein
MATKDSASRVVHLKIKRQDAPDKPDTRWEEFKVPYLPQMNVISALQQVQKLPQDDGRQRGRARGVGGRVPRRGVRRVHDGHQRPRAAGVLARSST